MPSSDKTAVIQYLFDKYWDEATQSLSKQLMTLSDVAEAIAACNELDGRERSNRNPANFVKDIVRSRNASKHWPAELTRLGFTAVQRTGTGDCFEFVRFQDGQSEAFPDLYRPDPAAPRLKHQSVSMSLESKSLGRTDEPWLIQTAVNLRLIEQHLAASSAHDVIEVTHLQMSVKLRATEIDAIYSAVVNTVDGTQKAIVTCEAKKHSERILVHQISNQVRAAFDTIGADLVIPLAIRSVKNVGIQVIEFASVARDEAETFGDVVYVQDLVYELVPPVNGI